MFSIFPLKSSDFNEEFLGIRELTWLFYWP